MSKKLINPAELYDCSALGMSQATVETELGLVFVSGQVDWNHQYETTENSIEGQARKALDNLKIALTAAGSSSDAFRMAALSSCFIYASWLILLSRPLKVQIVVAYNSLATALSPFRAFDFIDSSPNWN